MINTIIKELESLYSLKHIIRYNNLPRIKDESVAEHSYFVALIVARLHQYYDFNLEKALLMAIVHDIFEVHISDVPRNVKMNYPKLKIIMDEIEDDCIRKKYPEYEDIIYDFNGKHSVEALIVKLSDNLSCIQYADTEIKLGSNYYMPEVIKEAAKTIKIIEQQIEEYKLEHQRSPINSI